MSPSPDSVTLASRKLVRSRHRHSGASAVVAPRASARVKSRVVTVPLESASRLVGLRRVGTHAPRPTEKARETDDRYRGESSRRRERSRRLRPSGHDKRRDSGVGPTPVLLDTVAETQKHLRIANGMPVIFVVGNKGTQQYWQMVLGVADPRGKRASIVVVE